MASEFELIGALREIAVEHHVAASDELELASGDDAAVTRPPGRTATSVDAMVDGIHFRLDAAGPELVGHKALAVALSDLAAMGARAAEAYVQLGVPPDLPDADVHRLARGLCMVAADTGTAVAGGDVVASPVLFVAITVVGYFDRAGEPVRRRGASAGDLIFVSGELGGAAAGLALIEAERAGAPAAELPDEADPLALRRRQLEPTPRLALGEALARAGATAMIDISDGLGADAGHLGEASGVQLEIEIGRVPVAPGLAGVAEALNVEATQLLQGGEDYELLFTAPPSSADAIAEASSAAAVAVSEIGVVRELGAGGPGDEFVRLLDADRSSLPASGHDQLA